MNYVQKGCAAPQSMGYNASSGGYGASRKSDYNASSDYYSSSGFRDREILCGSAMPQPQSMPDTYMSRSNKQSMQ